MKATFALLTNRDIENQVCRLAWQINLRWQTGVQVRCLAPHISLKQPFDIGDHLDTLERYMAALAADTPPFSVTLTDCYVWENIFGVNVAETAVLRSLHNRLNRNLSELFGDMSAPHDGEGYHFHLTIALGGAPAETYRSIYDTYGDTAFATTFFTHELAMFVYTEPQSGMLEYMTHTVLPLTGS